LITSLTACSLHLHPLKAKEPQAAIKEDFASYKGGTKYTYFGLQTEVMAYADEYALTVWQAMDKLQKSVTDPQERLLVEYRKIALGTAAMGIAAGRNPAANLLDMVVFVTVQNMIVKEYWVPKIYGPKAQDLLAVHSRLEKEIWSLAGEIVTPDQLKELRNLIDQWHASHPEFYYVTSVRLKELTGLRGMSPVEAEQKVHTLLGEVEKSLGKVDEALILGERGMFYLQRMPRIMAFQTELLMDQLTANPEVRKLVGDADKIANSFENISQTAQGLPDLVSTERKAAIDQITKWLDQEHERLMADLKAQGPKAKDLVAESRWALVAGTDLVKSMDGLLARMRAERIRTNARPLDYVKVLAEADDAARHAKELVVMMDAFVNGEKAGVKPAALGKALNEINAQSKTVLNHIFLLAAGLILIFCVGLMLSLLGYRYLASRLIGPPRHPQS